MGPTGSIATTFCSRRLARNGHRRPAPLAVLVRSRRHKLVSSSCSLRASSYPGIPEADPLTMATPQILQLLYSFNTFCPEFSRCLDRLIQSDGEEHYLSNLQGSDMTRLVDFLDRVRAFLFAFFQFTKQILQALGTIPVTEDISRRCLHKLQAICSDSRILPSSYVISGGLVRVGDYPIASTNLSDVWEGTHNTTKVCIKNARITIRDRQDIERVGNRYRHALQSY